MADALATQLRDTRSRTLQLVSGLDEAQLMGPRLLLVNPLRWEVGHVAWFQEMWALRHLRGEPPILSHGDSLYDSAAVPHDSRWDLPLPSMADTLEYARAVLERVTELLAREPVSGKIAYFHRLALYHEDMHGEAFTYTRQTLAYPEPPIASTIPREEGTGALPGDVTVPGGPYLLGAGPDLPFVFDNEKWAHEVTLSPFEISRAPVTNAQFAEFVEAGGYRDQRWWSAEGWEWRLREHAERPVYWEPPAGRRLRWRRYDRVALLPPHAPVIHVNAYEAEAYCRWAGRRLPTEAEWEMAATGAVADGAKRLFPWGDEAPTPERANLEGSRGGCIDVADLPDGDSPYGCRQMIGNVWEWTSSRFLPYPGFVMDPYAEYSEPWFRSPHRVLRGGCWATRGRLLRNSWRNFYEPHRRDVFAGFRTCAT